MTAPTALREYMLPDLSQLAFESPLCFDINPVSYFARLSLGRRSSKWRDNSSGACRPDLEKVRFIQRHQKIDLGDLGRFGDDGVVNNTTRKRPVG